MGTFNEVASGTRITLPVETNVYSVVITDINTNNNPLAFGVAITGTNGFVVYGRRNNGVSDLWGRYIVIGSRH